MGMRRTATAEAPSVNTAVHVIPRDRVTSPSTQSRSPAQPRNTDVPLRLTASRITVPGGNSAVHVSPHVIPGGVDCTPPVPVPDRMTCRRIRCGGTVV